MALAGYGRASGERSGRREPASIRSRSSIGTSTASERPRPSATGAASVKTPRGRTTRLGGLLGTHLTGWQGAAAPASAGAALLQDVDRLGDAALPGLLGLGPLDLQHVPGLVAVG